MVRVIVYSFILFLSAIQVYSQSDYEKTQNFNAKFKEIEEAIISAKTLNECAAIEGDIKNFRDEFKNDKEFLDKALYPLDFDASFEKLTEILETRKADFTQISALQDKISILDRQNSSLLMLIEDLENSQLEDSKKIDSLNQLTAQLKASIKQRDRLVEGIVDSLLAEFVNKTFTLNDAERVSFMKYVEYHNLFYNVENTISENIQFLNVTRLQTKDFAQLKNDYTSFRNTWNKMGEKLAEVYLDNDDKTESIARINERFGQLNDTFNNKIWSAIHRSFRRKDITLLPFNNGEEFSKSVLGFIDDQIKNLDIRNKSDAEETYYTFVDGVWFKEVKTEWLPVLLEHKMFTEVQEDSIEERLAQWKKAVVQEPLGWWTYLLVIAIALIIFIAVKGMFKKKS